MRITGGVYKNKKIHLPKSATEVRPTSDKMRQAIYNLLAHAKWGMPIDDVRMIDAFCGSGIMGLEALSRGAQHVTFLDINRANIDVLKGILSQQMNVDGARYDAFVADMTKRIPKNIQPANLIFLDPPYRKGYVAQALYNFAQSNSLEVGAVCICEVERQADVMLDLLSVASKQGRKTGQSKGQEQSEPNHATHPQSELNQPTHPPFALIDERAYGDSKLVVLRFG